jgi:acyl dehydratase
MWGEGGSSPHIKTMGGNVLRLLHGREAYDYHTFIRPGDLITGQTWVVSIEEKESRSGSLEIVVLQTDYHNQRGEPVVTAYTTIVLRA